MNIQSPKMVCKHATYTGEYPITVCNKFIYGRTCEYMSCFDTSGNILQQLNSLPNWDIFPFPNKWQAVIKTNDYPIQRRMYAAQKGGVLIKFEPKSLGLKLSSYVPIDHKFPNQSRCTSQCLRKGLRQVRQTRQVRQWLFITTRPLHWLQMRTTVLKTTQEIIRKYKIAIL